MATYRELMAEILEPTILDKNDYKCFKKKTLMLPMLLNDQIELFVKQYNQFVKKKANHICWSDVARLAFGYFLENVSVDDIEIEPRSKHKFKE